MSGNASHASKSAAPRGTVRARAGRCRAALLGVAAAFAAIGAASPAAAQSGTIQTNHYSLDFFQGVSLAPIRVIGIGGAYAGVADGISGFVANASSPALRDPSSSKWVELDAAVSMSLPLVLFERSDFDNSGKIDQSYTDFIYLAAGGLLQLGPFGSGFIADVQRYTLRSGGVKTDVNVGRAHVLAAWSFFGGQFMAGGGARIGAMFLQTPDAQYTMLGAAPEFGFLIRPDWKSFRIGATFRMPVDAGELGAPQLKVEQGLRRAGGLVLPDHVVWPWELEVGLAVQVGPRPLNPQWINPHDQEAELRVLQEIERRRRESARALELASIADASERRLRAKEHEEARALEAEDDRRAFEKTAKQLQKERQARYWNWPREMLLVTAELLVTGDVPRGVGLEGFLGQSSLNSSTLPGAVIGSSGSDINFSPRFGIETEPIPGLVHTRLGSYYEPRRLKPTGEINVTEGVGRQHFTFGADLRVLTTTFWGLVPEITYTLQASVDLAPRYESFSVGIGNWK